MHYHAFAVDFDGTRAHDGVVHPDTIAALEQLRATHRRLILVTGRELPDVLPLLPRPDLFDRIVAENGGVLYVPANGEERLLADPPSAELVAGLRERGVCPLSIGRVVLGTWEPHHELVLDAIRTLGLEHQVTFNKGAVMVLPAGVNKGSGLGAALRDLFLSARNTLAIGDAENDHAMFDLVECSVAVRNALPAVKRHADLVTEGDHGQGVIEVVRHLLNDDMVSCLPCESKRPVLIGKNFDGSGIPICTRRENILIVGPSRSGKSTIAAGFLERLVERGYQCCVIDPEGDYECLRATICVGDSTRPPMMSEIVQILEHSDQSVVVNMLGVPYADRPAFYEELICQLDELQRLVGRPHWVIADEAHHMLPGHLGSAGMALPQTAGSVVLITVDPRHLPDEALQSMDVVIGTGPDPQRVLSEVAVAGAELPESPQHEGAIGEALIWRKTAGGGVMPMFVLPSRAEHQRHRRKYAQGDLGPAHSFYFRGPERRWNLPAANLIDFVQIADRLDNETWLFHLDCGDYSRWIREVIQDRELACAVTRLEKERDLPIENRRARLRSEIEQRYTLPV